MSSMGLALLYWLDLNEYLQKTVKDGCLQSYARGLSLLVAITFGVTVGYSRLFLGVHSMDQILYGWSVGVWLAVTFHFLMREPLEK